MSRIFTFLLTALVALCSGTTSLSQSTSPTLAPQPIAWRPAPVVVHVQQNGILVLNDNYFDVASKRLLVPGSDYSQSWVVSVDFANATSTATAIPPAITGGLVTAVGISKDGQYVYGWMDSPTSDPLGAGEGFFAPVGNPGSRTLIGYLPGFMNESRVRDMSANGIAVGNSAGTTAGCYWTASTGTVMLPLPGGATGSSGARAISANGIICYGTMASAGPGTEQPGAWIYATPYLLPSLGSGIIIGCSPNGLIAAGGEGFNAGAWLTGVRRPIYETVNVPLNGEGRDAVDSGFCVGLGLFNNVQHGFIWHPRWKCAMTIRAYILSRTGVDIGFDVTEANGIFQQGLFLYITGADANGGVAIQVIARP